MDQTSSVRNLNILLKEDREKGGKLEETYVPDAFKIRVKMHKLRKLLQNSLHRMRIGKMTEAVYTKRKSRIDTVLEKRKIEHDSLVEGALQLVSKAIGKKDFRVSVALLPTTVGGKKVYGIGKDLAQILVVRLIQRVLKIVYKVSMPPRDMLIGQIKALALDGMPKYIIRADVEQFYESVAHDHLLDAIHQSPELSIVVKRILTRLIKDYVAASGDEKGLPRGIGISAYLSEIYLAGIDRKIKSQEGVFYYARYVDDIVLMYAPQRNELADHYLSKLKSIFSEKGLLLNSKTRELNVLTEQKGKFEYLGYEFDLSPGKRGIRLSTKKEKKYKARIEKSFSDYQKKHTFIVAKAADELFVRCLFLTGNMRLFNRKSNAFIGIYFSNRFITDTAQLNGLDSFFQHKISTLLDVSLKRKLGKLSFAAGFRDKIFRNFDLEKLSEISQGWNHA
ncbi:MAG TPA: reverse transcriptase [Janthinobacterium sp.]|nr:reverse transcriptase [Janthinobacterium sp.]